MGFHFYADDTQLYLSFNSLSADYQVSSVSRVESCVREIDNWMTRNKLKLNRDKTELLVISSRYRPRPSLDSIVVGNCCVSLGSARNILQEQFSIKLYLQHHWLPLNYRIHFKILFLVYKCLNGLTPTYLSELLHYHNSPRLLRSSSQNLLVVPK